MLESEAGQIFKNYTKPTKGSGFQTLINKSSNVINFLNTDKDKNKKRQAFFFKLWIMLKKLQLNINKTLPIYVFKIYTANIRLCCWSTKMFSVINRRMKV